MAVIQISQIQVRRGLLQDLGQLGAGEFGWAVDKLRLFIGNGSTSEGAPYIGNTEVLTTNSDITGYISAYRYKGNLGGYQVTTGVIPVVRNMQDKLDDIINIKDFGAAGDGFTDDTDAIQRAIDEIYGRLALTTPVYTRRTINFHPGSYLISQELRIPPYCVFRNSGKGSVTISQTSALANCVIKTTTSSGLDAYSSNLVPVNATIGPIEMSGIVFRRIDGAKPIALIDSARDVSFTRCRFEGLVDKPTSVNSGHSVVITSKAVKSKNINFVECDFYKGSSAAVIDSTLGVSNVIFDRCTFSNVYQGIYATSNVSSTTGIRVTNSAFDIVSKQGIVTENTVEGVVSAFNIYLNVGNSYASTATSPVIEFGGNLSYSMADVITRNMTNDIAITAVQHTGNNSISTNAVSAVRLGNAYQTIGRSIIFNDASINYIPLTNKYRQGIINYSIERNEKLRTGTMQFTTNIISGETEFHDSYSELATVGVEMTVEVNSDSGIPEPYILCIADNSGQPSTITYDVKSLFN